MKGRGRGKGTDASGFKNIDELEKKAGVKVDPVNWYAAGTLSQATEDDVERSLAKNDRRQSSTPKGTGAGKTKDGKGKAKDGKGKAASPPSTTTPKGKGKSKSKGKDGKCKDGKGKTKGKDSKGGKPESKGGKERGKTRKYQ